MKKKKKILIIVLPILLLIIGVGVYLFVSRDKTSIIKVESWNDQGEYYELCETEIDYVSNDCSYFLPSDVTGFFDEIQNKEDFIGIYKWDGIENCYYFYWNNGIYAIRPWNQIYRLVSCVTTYESTSGEGVYCYPAPGGRLPDNAWTADVSNESYYSFDDIFGDYEEAVERFYGFFSEDYVSLDDENQTITVTVYNSNKKAVADDRKVVLDFQNKKINEVMLTTGE
jgi:hypothetical protein